MEILTVLKEKYPSMTKKQKQIADYMMAHPEQMTFITLKELSKAVDATEVTILKACSDFGYENFNEVKYEFRKYVSMQEQFEIHKENEYTSTAIPKYELEEREALLDAIRKEEKECVNHALAQLDLQKVIEAARIIMQGKRVVFCGRGISILMCKALQIWIGTSGLPGIVMDTELNDEIHVLLPLITEETVVVAFSFPDYYFMTTKIVEFSKKSGAKVIGITNVEEAPIAEFSDVLLLAPSSTRLFMNNLSSPMAVINLLASAVEIEVSASDRQMSADQSFTELFRQ
ncbi:MurR/RpiR family transcriptional regulator [Faecalicatena sp. Marseille-Q4148]|nr:MurR/RpiR family transcriptional regulator [Faecalicatena sp. Marseille-Q4148]